MTRRIPACFFVLALSSAAAADEPWESWQGEIEAEAFAVLSTETGDNDVIDREQFLYGARVKLDADTVLESGLQLGGVIELAMQRDHPARPGFAGVIGQSAGLDVIGGAYPGVRAGPVTGETGPRGQMETAYVFAKGGYGEVRIGRDRGVAARFHEGAPSVLRYARTDSARLDPSGRALVRSDHDITGPSAKLTVTSPRLLGVRGGLSYTPDADTGGLDRNTSFAGASGALKPENVLEGSVNVDRRLPDEGPRLQASLGYSQSDVAAMSVPVAVSGDVETISVGANAAFKTVTIGGSYLTSETRIGAVSGDYTAWSVGATKDFDPLTVGIDYGAAEDELTGLQSDAWSISAGRSYGKSIHAGVAYKQENMQFSAQPDAESREFVVEITLSM